MTTAKELQEARDVLINGIIKRLERRFQVMPRSQYTVPKHNLRDLISEIRSLRNKVNLLESVIDNPPTRASQSHAERVDEK